MTTVLRALIPDASTTTRGVIARTLTKFGEGALRFAAERNIRVRSLAAGSRRDPGGLAHGHCDRRGGRRDLTAYWAIFRANPNSCPACPSRRVWRLPSDGQLPGLAPKMLPTSADRKIRPSFSGAEALY